MAHGRVVFDKPNWFKGNLHTHTTRSDGKKEPEDAINWYKRHGYHFLAVTDHDLFSPGRAEAGFIVLSGVEMSTHTVGLNMNSVEKIPVGGNQQQEIDFINAAGGVSIVAHPYWHGLTFAQLESLQGYLAVEVFNSECDLHNGRGYAGIYWDYLLSLGKRVLGVAVDDTHWEGAEAGGGWICVNSDSLTAEELVQSLREGKFYSSQGPEIKQIVVEGDTITVECSPAQRVNFITNAPAGRVIRADDAQLTQASFTARPGLTYVRIEVVDERGRTAWSNPIWLNG
mgnify:CR=1 FL=1